jgi:hypothetical protein
VCGVCHPPLAYDDGEIVRNVDFRCPPDLTDQRRPARQKANRAQRGKKAEPKRPSVADHPDQDRQSTLNL